MSEQSAAPVVQLRSKRGVVPRRRMSLQLSKPAEAHLRLLTAVYQQHLHRPVSASLIVRRALEGLVNHVGQLQDRQALADEMLCLVKHVS